MARLSRLYRPTYTKPLPADAEIVRHKDKRFARFTDRRTGKLRKAPLAKDGKRVLLHSKTYWGQYVDEYGAERKLRSAPTRAWPPSSSPSWCTTPA